MDETRTVQVRLLVSPAWEPRETEIRRRLPPSASIPMTTIDGDVDVTVVACGVRCEDLVAAATALAEAVGREGAEGRTLRCDIQPQTGATELDDETLRATAIAFHGALSCPVFVARRRAAMSAWRSQRPMRWAQRGLEIAASAQPMLPFGGSASDGLAIEVGAPTLIYKARIAGLGRRDAECVAAAIGGGDAGLVGAAAYAMDGREPGASFVLCEIDADPGGFVRLLSLVDLEARRYGGTPGAGAFLSQVPLSTLTRLLEVAMGLRLETRQIIETHLAALAGG